MTFIAKDSRWMPQLGSQNLEFGIHARIPNSEFPIPNSAVAWSVWGLAATYYLAAFYLRSSPAVMTTELMRDFGISASQLGNFSAVYFYAYIAMQIPTGVLVDSWGARRLLIGGAIAAAIGTCLFGVTNSYGVASIGRLIVGAATAVGWVVTLKLATHWFPRQRFAMLSGLGLMMGNVGALVAQVPLRVLVEQFGWRAVAFGSAGVVLAVGAAAWAVVTNDPLERGFRSCAPVELQRAHLTIGQLLREFPTIFTYRNTWLIFLAQGGFVGAMLSFTGLWGPTYLRQRFTLAPTEAAAVCSVMIVCWAVASPIAGYLSDTIGRRKPGTGPALGRSDEQRRAGLLGRCVPGRICDDRRLVCVDLRAHRLHQGNALPPDGLMSRNSDSSHNAANHRYGTRER